MGASVEPQVGPENRKMEAPKIGDNSALKRRQKVMVLKAETEAPKVPVMVPKAKNGGRGATLPPRRRKDPRDQSEANSNQRCKQQPERETATRAKLEYGRGLWACRCAMRGRGHQGTNTGQKNGTMH